MKLTEEKYRAELNKFFGKDGPQLGTPKYTADQCIGFVRKLLTGEDPYADKRMTYDDPEASLAGATPRLNDGDLIPYIYLQYNVLQFPPSAHHLFWKTTTGKTVSRNMFPQVNN